MSAVTTGSLPSQPQAAVIAAPTLDAQRVKAAETKTKASDAEQKAGGAQAETSNQEPTAVGSNDLGAAVDSINQFVNAQGRTLNFSVDEESGKPVVKVIDFESKDVIRQIPSEEVLDMARAIKRLQGEVGSATGLLIDKKV